MSSDPKPVLPKSVEWDVYTETHLISLIDKMLG